MSFHRCDRCGRHALALQGIDGRPVCIKCLDGEDAYHRFVCSHSGCMNRPLFMAVLKEGDTSPVMLCGRHFAEVMDSILSYLEVPPWLIAADQIRLEEDAVVFEFEPSGEGRAMASCVEGSPEDPHRVERR